MAQPENGNPRETSVFRFSFPGVRPETQDLLSFRACMKGAAPWLSDADCELFRDSLRKREYAAKEFFLEPGQVCGTLGFVLAGAFRVFHDDEGREGNTQFALPRDFVVEYGSFVSQAPSRYAIQALAPGSVLIFDYATLQRAYAASHGWERFGRLIAETAYRRARERAESFVFLDAEARYLKALRDEPELFRRVPLYHIASYLGMERESLSRIRRKLARKSGG